jgi:hypothetical protein
MSPACSPPRAALLFAFAAWLWAGLLRAEPPQAAVLEHQVKAAFLYKFLAYVEWPPEALPQHDTPIVLGVVGAPELADELSRICTHRMLDGHRLQVRRIDAAAAAEDLHLLFIGRQPDDRLHELIERTRSRAILTVADSAELQLPLQPVIVFAIDQGRVRFDVAQRAAERTGLKLSSRLLSVARRVDADPAPTENR